MRCKACEDKHGWRRGEVWREGWLKCTTKLSLASLSMYFGGSVAKLIRPATWWTKSLPRTTGHCQTCKTLKSSLLIELLACKIAHAYLGYGPWRNSCSISVNFSTKFYADQWVQVSVLSNEKSEVSGKNFERRCRKSTLFISPHVSLHKKKVLGIIDSHRRVLKCRRKCRSVSMILDDLWSIYLSSFWVSNVEE